MPTTPLTLYPAGELDLMTAPAEFDPRQLGQASAVRVDLRYVTFIDAFALGRIVRLRNILSDRGGALTVVGPKTRVAWVFAIAGLASLLSDPAYSSP